MSIEELWTFKFAGSILKGKLIEQKIVGEKKVFIFKDKDGYIYPVNKEDICGNLKQ